MTEYTPQMLAILDDLSLFDDWEDKYAYLIDLGKKLDPLPPADKVSDNLVIGCTSQVWLTATIDEHQRYQFCADSDAIIVKGLISLLLSIYTNQSAATIAQIDIKSFFMDAGLSKHLSPSRSNGLLAMVSRITALAS